jgi:signal recognition particle subunit SRP54
MLTLIEQAEKTFDQEQTAALAGKLASGEGFTLEDFVQQLAMVRKLGPIGNLLGMLPGAAQNREMLSQVSDKDLDRAAAIVNSMTPAERRNPKIINGSRRARIATGSGVAVGEVSNLVTRFLEGQKMMRQMMGGGGMPGMPGMPGMRRASKQAKKTKKKPKGGRPGGSPAGAAGKQPPGLPLGTQPGSAGTGGGLGGLGGLPGNLPPGLGGEGGFRLPGPGPGSQPGPQHLPPGLRGGGANRRGKKGR